MKYFVYYSNGKFESVDTISSTFVHMLKIGVVKLIIDLEKGEVLAAEDNEQGFIVSTIGQTTGLN